MKAIMSDHASFFLFELNFDDKLKGDKKITDRKTFKNDSAISILTKAAENQFTKLNS